jgi:hypothetical protein
MRTETSSAVFGSWEDLDGVTGSHFASVEVTDAKLQRPEEKWGVLRGPVLA